MKQQSNGFSIASLVLGIIGLLLGCVIIGFIPALIGLIFGIVALAQHQSKGLAIAGIVCSAVGLLISFVILIASFSDTSTKSGTSQGSSQIESETSIAAESSDSLVDLIDADFYARALDKNNYCAALVLTNNSDRTVALEANFVAKDASGNNIGAWLGTADAIAPGQTTCLYTNFENPDDISYVDYTLTATTETYWDSIYGDLTMEYNDTGSKCVATVTNIGEKTADFPTVICLFFKNGSLVCVNESYAVDNDGELKPGVSKTVEVDCYAENYDDMIAILCGQE